MMITRVIEGIGVRVKLSDSIKDLDAAMVI
jgi:hypothetical protein